MNIRNILHSGDVVRFHSHAGIDKQKNAEHQWGVALIVQHIYPDCSKDLLLAAMTHDAAEYLTGDVPFPVKKEHSDLALLLRDIEKAWEIDNGVYFSLKDEEKLILKMGDTLEGMWFCIHQVRMGNVNAKRPFRKWRKFFADNFCPDYEIAYSFYEILIREMEEL